MFCPNCGGHQAEGRKFCTSCGTNLLAVSQALSGRGPAAPGGVVAAPNMHEVRRQEDLSKGVKLAIIGGAFLAIQFFGFLFSLPFRNGGSPFGFFSFVALVVMAIGVSRIVSARPAVAQGMPRQAAPPPATFAASAPRAALPVSMPEPIFEEPARTTGGLAAHHPGASVTEEETQHLPAAPSHQNGT